MSVNQLRPKFDNNSTVSAGKSRREYSYVLVVCGPERVDLFKTYASGSVHLAPFASLEEGIAFVDSLPPARLLVI